MELVNIVTIKNKIPLYKDNIQSTSIEMIELEEVGFEVVANKTLYQVGDKAVFIQPDCCVPDTSLFESFIRPNGNESKSMLGRVKGLPRRVRAKKFNLSKEPSGDFVYSQGILLPYHEVQDYLYQLKDIEHKYIYLEGINLTKKLNITKYEESNLITNNNLNFKQIENKFPEGLYKTSEENINNVWHKITFPIVLIGTEKIDGSSITIGVTPEIPEGFICSRNIRKEITIKKIVGRKNKKWYKKLLFWIDFDLNIYKKFENTDDNFIKYGLPYLNILLKDGSGNRVLRGELNGWKILGSNNKNNPANKQLTNIKFFNIDKINKYNEAEKISYSDFKLETEYLKLPKIEEIFIKEFNSKEELISTCNNYFKDNMVEGIVVKTTDNKFSAKIMNLKYDSMK